MVVRKSQHFYLPIRSLISRVGANRFVCALVVCVSFSCAAVATSEYTYKKGEYVTVNDGVSPNKRFSITTHGEGDTGRDNFHVYLMAEPGHRKIGPLEEIGPPMDTGANAYYATWSPNSKHVAIEWRLSHQEVDIRLYRIEHGRAYPVKLPNIAHEAANLYEISDRKIPSDKMCSTEFPKWTPSGDFYFETRVAGYTPSPNPPPKLAAYFIIDGKPGENNGKYTSLFCGAMTCKLIAHDKLNIVKIQSTISQYNK